MHGTSAVVGEASNRVRTATTLFQKHGILGLVEIVEMTSRLCPCVKVSRDDQIESKRLSMYEKKHGIGVVLLDDGMQVRIHCFAQFCDMGN